MRLNYSSGMTFDEVLHYVELGLLDNYEDKVPEVMKRWKEHETERIYREAYSEGFSDGECNQRFWDDD